MFFDTLHFGSFKNGNIHAVTKERTTKTRSGTDIFFLGKVMIKKKSTCKIMQVTN